MKALRTLGCALLLVLILATVTLGGGLLMVPLTVRPFLPLGRLLLRLALADDVLGLRATWWLWMLAAVERSWLTAADESLGGGTERINGRPRQSTSTSPGAYQGISSAPHSWKPTRPGASGASGSRSSSTQASLCTSCSYSSGSCWG